MRRQAQEEQRLSHAAMQQAAAARQAAADVPTYPPNPPVQRAVGVRGGPTLGGPSRVEAARL
eukprot:11408735-Prorocentrum_lima.AAC.1